MQTLKEINFLRAVIFSFLYLILSVIIYLVFSILFTSTFFLLNTTSPQIADVVYSLGFIFILATPLVSYLIIYLLTLTKFKIFKFKLSERFVGCIVIPFIFTFMLAIWFNREVTFNPSSFDNSDGPSIGLLFWPTIIILIPIIQIFIFTLGEIAILSFKKAKKI